MATDVPTDLTTDAPTDMKAIGEKLDTPIESCDTIADVVNAKANRPPSVSADSTEMDAAVQRRYLERLFNSELRAQLEKSDKLDLDNRSILELAKLAIDLGKDYNMWLARMKEAMAHAMDGEYEGDREMWAPESTECLLAMASAAHSGYMTMMRLV